MTEPSRSRPGLLRAGILALPTVERQRALAMHVQRMAASLLQLDDPQQVTLDTPWTELGFDSLRAVDLCAALAHELDLPLRSTLLFDQPQPRALVEHLLARIGDAASASMQPEVPRAEPRSVRERAAVAIVGAACRLPGADGLEAFWNLLLDGRDAVGPIPRERFDTGALYDPDPSTPGAIYVRHAALLDDLAGFDAAAFGISPREAAALDPQQRLLLEVAWHAFEHANLPPHRLAAHRVGVYVGIRSGEYFDSQTARTPADADAYYHTGNALSTAAGRIAYTFGFRGPCLSIDTACSGSLVALHTAVRALRAGECDVALVAGVNAILDPVSMAGLCRARMLSKDGRCKSFDARADGYGRGEGCGAVVLRRHADAEAAGERVLALVLGTAINQDGRSGGLTVPHGPAQQEVVGMALADAGLAPSAIDYVEAHGTGTSLGDPIEIAALDAAFAARERSLPIGSVKTSIGHLEAAAGIAGLLKVVLSLRARTLPANLHFETPNPHVDWANSRVRVVAAREDLRPDGPLFAGVSSFGFSGTNAHAVLGTAPAKNKDSAAAARGPFLLPLQAMDASALRELARRHAACLAREPIDLATWCHTACVARRSLPVRAAFVAADAASLVRALVAFADGDDRAASALHGVQRHENGGFDAFDERAHEASCTEPSAHAHAPGEATTRLLCDLAVRWARGDAVDLAAMHAHAGAPTAELPLYPFQRRRHWHTRVDRPHVRRTGAHPLLGERRDTSLLAEGQSLFAASLAASQPAWLADHRLDRGVVLPAAVAIELCWAAELAHGRELPLVVEGVTVRARVELGAEPTALELLRTRTADRAIAVRLRARATDGTWLDVLDGEVPVAARAIDANAAGDALAAATARCPRVLDARALYDRCAALALAYGPAFRAVHDVRLGDGELVARVRLPATLSTAGFALHPVLFDACWHVAVALLPADSNALLPVAVERATVCRRDVRDLVCHLRVRSRSKDHCVVDCVLHDEGGALVARLDGLQSMAAVSPTANPRGLDEWVHHVACVELDDDERIAAPSRIAVLGWPRLAEALCAAWPQGRAIAVDAKALAAAATTPFDTVLWLAEPDDERASPDATLRQFDQALAAVQASLALPTHPRLVLVTHGIANATTAQPGAAPHAAALLGLWRTLAHEHADTRPSSIDLDPNVPAHAVAIHAAAVVAELQRRAHEPEIAVRDGRRLARRLRRGRAPTLPRPANGEAFRVRAEAYGAFESLRCMPLARRAPANDEVEVAMVAAALNFKDVLYARGLLRDFAAREGVHAAVDQPLGFEGTGVVTATGTDVVSLREGDRVVVLAPDCLASHVTVRADAVFALPDGCDPVAAAGTPIAFATAIHALLERAAVQRGETVLVHTAAGGVGQAAIQLLQDLGARVLATCSEGKQAFVKALGAFVVGSGRAHDFGPEVMAATDGRGVDVVLNTRTGDGVPRSLDVLRHGGRFVELGKLGVWTAEQVHRARPDVHYHAFDLGEGFAADPTQKPRLLARVRDLLRTGRIRPVTTTAMPIERAAAAFAHLADGASVGKVVLTLPTTDGTRLRPDRTYLVTGASGGFGPALAKALVEKGARHLALLARGPIPGPTCEGLRANGCSVTPLSADVADETSLATALAHLRAHGPPLGGLVHAAGALADATLLQLDADAAHTALRAKAVGALLLDRLTADDPIEFFVTTGSMAATLGSAGQAAYAAANAFLEAFAAHRRARGLPSTCIALGPLDGAGMTQRLSAPLRARLARRGIDLLPEAHAARLVVDERNAPFDLSVLPIRWAEWRLTLGTEAPPTLAELDPTTAPTKSTAASPFAALPDDERRARLRRVVAEAIAEALGFADPEPVLGDRAFRDLGLDSLLAVEAKEQIEDRVGRRLPATLLFDFPDLDSLVAHLAARP